MDSLQVYGPININVIIETLMNSMIYQRCNNFMRTGSMDTIKPFFKLNSK